MKLVTVQPPAVMVQLARGERVYGNPDFDLDTPDDHSMQDAYDWLVKQMASRIGPITAPSTFPTSPYRGGTSSVVCYPMWAWVLPPEEGVGAFIPMNPDQFDYTITLEIPDELVVCTDYDMWHHVLNKHSIQLYEDEPVNTEESWQRIFGVDPKAYRYLLESPDRDYMNLDAPPTIQATVWYIDPAWITKTEPKVKGLL